MGNEIKLWAFYYNPMIHDSSSYIESYHRTKKGANEAMKKHKDLAKIEWGESNEWHKKQCLEGGYKFRSLSKFGSHEAWHVNKFTLIIQD